MFLVADSTRHTKPYPCFSLTRSTPSMEAKPLAPAPPLTATGFEPDTEKIKRTLLHKGVFPTPKIVHTLRKKAIQKHNRKLAKQQQTHQHPAPFSDEETHFQTLKHEYKQFTKAIQPRTSTFMVGRPWEKPEPKKLRDAASSGVEYNGEKLNWEELKELKEMLEKRKREELNWVLDDDIEVPEGGFSGEEPKWDPTRRQGRESQQIRFVVARLSSREISKRDWKFTRIMKQSGLQFTEGQLLKIVEGLGDNGGWKQAISVVEWVYSAKEFKRSKSRFVHTKLLAVLGKARRPQEALDIFNRMRGDCHIYPDMAAYHSISVTLGQAGFVRELVKIIECMRQKPTKIPKAMHRKNWDPSLEPDVVVYNAVLNSCVPSHQWKGVFWVFEQLRKSGLKPNGSTYGLAMEVMLKSGKHDLVHEFFRKMKRSGEAPKALTYKVLVRTFWEEGKVNEALEAVRDMEKRGVVGIASVYYELACCLCRNGRWEDAMAEVVKMLKLPRSKPLEIAFTGMITSSMDGGHIDDCISIFEQMKDYCTPNIGTINVMLKVYGRNDMFSKAKKLFEDIKSTKSGPGTSVNTGGRSLIPDEYTYSSMLEASASALQWEYFEHVYREMALVGYGLNQTKHAKLFVEASRAGKWYLLEHAFDTILEAEDIPHPLFFTEMILQATAQGNYDKAVTLINTMAHAPFQVSEEQWKEHFVKNGDSIGSLNELSKALSNSDVATEATVANLKRALQSFCESPTSADYERPSLPDGSVHMMAENLDPVEGPLVSNRDGMVDLPKEKHSSGNDEDDSDIKMVSRSLNYVFYDDGNKLWTIEEDSADGASSESIDCSGDNFLTFFESRNSDNVNEVEHEDAVDEIDDSPSDLPSPSEILNAWQESR